MIRLLFVNLCILYHSVFGVLYFHRTACLKLYNSAVYSIPLYVYSERLIVRSELFPEGSTATTSSRIFEGLVFMLTNSDRPPSVANTSLNDSSLQSWSSVTPSSPIRERKSYHSILRSSYECVNLNFGALLIRT